MGYSLPVLLEGSSLQFWVLSNQLEWPKLAWKSGSLAPTSRTQMYSLYSKKCCINAMVAWNWIFHWTTLECSVLHTIVCKRLTYPFAALMLLVYALAEPCLFSWNFHDGRPPGLMLVPNTVITKLHFIPDEKVHSTLFLQKFWRTLTMILCSPACRFLRVNTPPRAFRLHAFHTVSVIRCKEVRNTGCPQISKTFKQFFFIGVG
jgi:hypothetical protein